MKLTDEEFRLFRTLIHEESGIYLKENRKDFLQQRILKRMTDTSMSSPYWYYKYLKEKGDTELVRFLDLLTINETSFFRNRAQMDLFRQIVLPDVLGKRKNGSPRDLRIWSAGCSTGEEPYTIAMIAHETIPDLSRWDVKIFASDLSLSVLETASRGEYDFNKVYPVVDDMYIERYFQQSRGHFRVRDEIRKLVVFDFHNLKNDNGLVDLDVIFCRNVMIYFDEEEQIRLMQKMYRSLNPGGYLLLGHAESLHGKDTGFEFIYKHKGTAYRKPAREDS